MIPDNHPNPQTCWSDVLIESCVGSFDDYYFESYFNDTCIGKDACSMSNIRSLFMIPGMNSWCTQNDSVFFIQYSCLQEESVVSWIYDS